MMINRCKVKQLNSIAAAGAAFFLFSLSVFGVGSRLALAQSTPPLVPSANSSVAPAGAPESAGASFAGIPSPLRSIPPSSLLDSRLHPAVLPQEAELSCSVASSCMLGLTRGLAVGGDVFRSFGVTTLGQHFLESGAWTYVDFGAAYQLLRRSERQSSFNAAIGLRSYSYKNSDDAKLARTGLTLRTAYAEAIYPAYTQGLVFEIHSAQISTDGGADKPFERNDTKRVRPVIKEFANFSRSHPSLRLLLPADLEIINWKPSDLEIEAPLRGYLRLTPTYEHADLILKDSQETQFSWVEKRFALQVMALAAYVSPEEKSGRYGLLGGLGIEVGSSRAKIESKVPADGENPQIPSAPMVRGKVEIQATYQF
jgi:hypothetical protein